MTVTTTLDRQYFDGDGSNKVFPFNFRFFTNDQIYVSLIAPDGTVTPQILTTNYTLSGALQAGGGTVTMLVAPPFTMPATRVFVQRILPQVQPTSIRNQGKFYPEIHEDAFDRLTMLIQQALSGLGNALQLAVNRIGWDFKGFKGINVGSPTNPTDAATKGYVDTSSQSNTAYTDAQMLRAIRVQPGETVTPLGFSVSRAGKLLGFDSNGQPVAVVAMNSSAADLELRLANGNGPTSGVVNVRYHGAVADGVTDNRKAFQAAIDEAESKGCAVYIPGGKLPYMIDLTVWIPSGMTIYGDGGKNKRTIVKAVNGHFTDMFVAGLHNEGVNFSEPGRTLLHRNGIPYLADNIGNDITFRGIYINGNGVNAGLAPEFPLGSGYRGCNILFRYVDGVTLNDVFSEFAPNDCAQVARARRISITDSEFSRNFLIGNVIGGTRNGLTVAGTLSGLGFPTPDFITLSNITAAETEDLGIAVQFTTNTGFPTTLSGAVNISNIVTYKNATYGLAVEISGDGNNQPERENFNITNVLSIKDSQRTGETYGAVLVSHRSRAANISNIVIRDSGGHGLIFSGTKTVNLSNILVDGYNTGGFQDIRGVFGYLVSPGLPETCSLSNVTVKGGAGRAGDTAGVHITGYKYLTGTGVIVDGTSFVTTADSAAMFLAAEVISFTASHAIGSATNGWRITGFSDLSLDGCTARNSGKGGGASQKIGFNIGPGTNRKGRILGCNSYDDQGVPTQAIGYLLGSSASDSITITASDAYGNTSAPVTNLGMPNARIHNNGFPYTGVTLPFDIGGNGGYLSGIRFGNSIIWVEIATGKLRVKTGTPTSDSDGTVVGTQT